MLSVEDPDSSIWLLHAFVCEEEVVQAASDANLALVRRIRVEFKRGKGPKRTILQFVPAHGPSANTKDTPIGNYSESDPQTTDSTSTTMYTVVQDSVVTVRGEDEHWTDEFIQLTQEYYDMGMGAARRAAAGG